jgi:mono/diheme cytochrome c family protein
MWKANFKILMTVVMTLGVFTVVSNVIPQVSSAVPELIVINADMTPDELAAIGENVYLGVGGCTACHGLGTRAPDLLSVAGTICTTRNLALTCKEYLYESLVNPLATIVEGFQPIMLDQSRTLGQPELWTLVAFLESQGGEITVTADDISGALAAAEAAEAVAVTETAPMDPGDIDPLNLISVNGCLACHAMAGEGGQVGPPFGDLIGQDHAFIREGIINPNASIAEGFEAFAGTMPPIFGDLMSPVELDVLIEFLATGTVETVGGEEESNDDES